LKGSGRRRMTNNSESGQIILKFTGRFPANDVMEHLRRSILFLPRQFK
jgi:hypothetical protein